MSRKDPDPWADTPTYNVGSSELNKWRRIARLEGFNNLTRTQLHGYGRAVEEAVLRSQRAHLKQEANHKCPCASGTWINTDDGAIGAAVRQQQRSALARAVENDRKRRKDWEIVELYNQAMDQKRKLLQHQKVMVDYLEKQETFEVVQVLWQF